MAVAIASASAALTRSSASTESTQSPPARERAKFFCAPKPCHSAAAATRAPFACAISAVPSSLSPSTTMRSSQKASASRQAAMLPASFLAMMMALSRGTVRSDLRFPPEWRRLCRLHRGALVVDRLVAWRGGCRGATHQGGGGMAGHETDQDRLAARGLHQLVTDHILAPVIAALDQDARPHALDQLERRVVPKHGHEIHRFERGQHLGARMDVLQRAALALQPPHRGIVVEADHQTVADAARLRQQLDVTAMQEVEAAIGEA